jgi:hypothetical protein
MLINANRWVVLGRRFDASLQEIDEFPEPTGLREPQAKRGQTAPLLLYA